jgi:hypothetical protein
VRELSRKRIIFILSAVLFVLTMIPVVLFDLNLLLFGEGVLIRKSVITAVFLGLLFIWTGFFLFFHFVFARVWPKNATEPILTAVLTNLYHKSIVNISIDEHSGKRCFIRSTTTDATLSKQERHLLCWLFNDRHDCCGLLLKYMRIGRWIGFLFLLMGEILAYVFDRSVFFIFFFLGIIFFSYCDRLHQKIKTAQALKDNLPYMLIEGMADETKNITD